MNFREHFVPRGQYRIYAREYAGAEPGVSDARLSR